MIRNPSMMASGRSRLRGRTRRLGIVLATLLVLSAAGEILLRLAPDLGGAQNLIRMQGHASTGHYVPDPELGALWTPFVHEPVQTAAYGYTLQTDHAGFPNLEPWPGQVDVVVLGNSLLDGPGVGLDGQFTTLLEHRLGDRTVLNLGLPGAGNGHRHLIYRRFAKPLHPSLVLAVLWVIWDIDNTQQFDQWLRESKPDPDFTHYRFTFDMTHQSAGQMEPSGLSRTLRFVRSQLWRSCLLRAGYHGAESLLGGEAIPERVTWPSGEDLLLSVSDQLRLAKGMDRPETPDIREVFFRPLEQLKSEVEADGGRFLVVLVPSKEELYAADKFPAVLRPIQEVRAGLAARGLMFLDLYPVFGEHGRAHPLFYRTDAHLNASGNQLVADALATWIADQAIFTAPAVTAVAPDQ